MIEQEDVGYKWDKRKYDTVRNARNITFWEVVSVLEAERFVEIPHESDIERFHVVAESALHRTLVVVVSEEELPIYRIITAFEAEGRFLDEFNEHIG